MRRVGGRGPLNARLVYVGEGPGRTEEKLGAPFVGRVGQNVERLLRNAGFDPGEVRFNNAVPYNITMPKEPAAMAALVRSHWGHLQDDLDVLRPRVIVACGRAALYRLTGKHKITAESGGVWPASQLVPPGHGGLPPDCVVVASIHPASVMRTKVGAGWLRVNRAIEKAVRYANGEEYVARFAGQDLDIVLVPLGPRDDEKLDAELSNAGKVAIDTEFDAETGTPFLVGLSVDGRKVMQFAPSDRLLAVLRKHLLRRDLVKVAHYHVADTGALARVGVDTVPPWWDTLEGFSHLYPDLPVGLAHVGMYYELGYHNHKSMDHADREYNAIDVKLAWDAEENERVELAEAGNGMLETFIHERMLVAATFGMMQDRGLRIDQTERRERVARSLLEEESTRELIAAEAKEKFAQRAAQAAKAIEELEAKVDAETARAAVGAARCPVKGHDTYAGLGKKKFSASNPACCCKDIYASEAATAFREALGKLRKEINKLKNQSKRWAAGFNPGSNDQVKWLLYDKAGYGLRKQYKDGKLTTNADAINKLATLRSTQAVPGAPAMLERIKTVQHLRKWRSTFYFATPNGEAKIDSSNLVHPPMRAFGTGTGRPAGGADEATDERKPNPYAFNIMNVPGECRGIYVPHTAADLVRLAPRFAPKEEVETEIDEEEGDDQ